MLLCLDWSKKLVLGSCTCTFRTFSSKNISMKYFSPSTSILLVLCKKYFILLLLLLLEKARKVQVQILSSDLWSPWIHPNRTTFQKMLPLRIMLFFYFSYLKYTWCFIINIRFCLQVYLFICLHPLFSHVTISIIYCINNSRYTFLKNVTTQMENNNNIKLYKQPFSISELITSLLFSTYFLTVQTIELSLSIYVLRENKIDIYSEYLLFKSHASICPGWTIRSVYGPYYRRNIGRRNTHRKVIVYGRYCLGIRHRIHIVLLCPRLRGYTDRIVSVYGIVYVPYYCAPDYVVIRFIYGRKLAIFSSCNVRKRPVKMPFWSTWVDMVAIIFNNYCTSIYYSYSSWFITNFYKTSYI